MYLLVVILLAVMLSILEWGLVMSAPRVLSMVIPRRLSYGVGIGLLVLAVFSAFTDAHVTGDAMHMLRSFVSAFAGLWFILAPSAAARGSYDDNLFIRRLVLMVALLMGAIIVSLYAHDSRVMAILELLLITAGFWVITNYFQLVDRRR